MNILRHHFYAIIKYGVYQNLTFQLHRIMANSKMDGETRDLNFLPSGLAPPLVLQRLETCEVDPL